MNGTAVELKESTGTGDQTKFFYDLTEAGEVTITFTGGYLGAFEVTF